MEVLTTCKICGGNREDAFHAVMQCPHALNLREAMNYRWCLPVEKNLQFSGPDWLLRVIDEADPESAGKLLLIFWRAWFIRNELTHANRKLSITGSISFLENYWNTLCSVREQGVPDHKGKKPMFSVARTVYPKEDRKGLSWVAPKHGWNKINVDGAFTAQGGPAIGVVIRDAKGMVLLSAW